MRKHTMSLVATERGTIMGLPCLDSNVAGKSFAATQWYNSIEGNLEVVT